MSPPLRRPIVIPQPVRVIDPTLLLAALASLEKKPPRRRETSRD